MQSVSRLILISSLLLAAWFTINPAWGRVDTLRAFPEKRFLNGAMDFGQYMGKNLRYPKEAMQAATVGTELVSIIITPSGQLMNPTVINSLGKAIDREVIRVIEGTQKMWMAIDQSASQDSIMLFLPVTFTLEDRSGNHGFYVEAVKPDFILNETVVVGYSSQTTYGLHDDAYYIKELSEALPKKDYKRMLKMVSELIRRNPYSDKLYLQRAKIEQELGQTEEACSDYKKIVYFLGNAHFPKRFIQNCPDPLNRGSLATKSAPTSKRSTNLEEIFTVVEIPPSFPGGQVQLDDYLRQQVHYPEAALNKKVQGNVSVTFIVSAEGTILDVVTLKGPGHGLNEEAVRMIKSMPNWIPGKQSGRSVNVRFSLEVPFVLPDTKSQK